MESTLISCPYCNASFTLSGSAATAMRIACPRCHETFPNKATLQNQRNALLSAYARDHEAPSPADASRPSSNRKIAFRLLALMLTMAGVGLAFALWTVKDRRQHDRPNASDPPAVTASLPPWQLPALGYVPTDSNVVAAIRVAEALKAPTGRQLLSQARFGAFEFSSEQLALWTGLSLTDIDHLVVGLRVDDRFPPRAVLVVQTLKPCQPERIRAALHADREMNRGKKTIVPYRLEQPPLKLSLWFAGPQTLVYGYGDAGLDDVPLTPYRDTEQLSSPLQAALKEQLGKDDHVWMVGHAADWKKTIVALLFEGLPKEPRELLGTVQTWAVSLKCTDGMQLRADLQSVDEKSTQALETYATQTIAERTKTVPDEASPLASELARSFKVRRDKSWVILEAAVGTKSVEQALTATKKE